MTGTRGEQAHKVRPLRAWLAVTDNLCQADLNIVTSIYLAQGMASNKIREGTMFKQISLRNNVRRGCSTHRTIRALTGSAAANALHASYAFIIAHYLEIIVGKNTAFFGMMFPSPSPSVRHCFSHSIECHSSPARRRSQACRRTRPGIVTQPPLLPLSQTLLT